MTYETFEQLQEDLKGCTKCGLCKTRTNVVVGMGNPHAEVLFVGEGPGKNEDLQGLPFVGRSGQLLDKFLASIDLYRDKNIYITNTVKCRPPENRDPLPEEQEACLDYLRCQFKLINPKIIVCVGRIAAMRLIKPDFKVMSEHGKWFIKNGVHMMGTLHPAALLRSPGNKPLAFADFLALQEKIGEICTHTYEGVQREE